MPKNYEFSYLPLRFSIVDTERIRSIIAEKFSNFYIDAPSDSFFALSNKLFPFPNEVSSIRIIIAIIHRLNIDETDSEDSQDEKSLDMSGNSAGNKHILPELLLGN